MDYGKWITTPANTPISAKQVTNFKVWRGVVHRVFIYFPAGQEGTCRVQVFHGGRQVWPSYDGQYYSGDGFPINFRESYNLHKEVNILTVKTWNVDTVNDHTIFASFPLLPAEVLEPQKSFFESFNKFIKRLGF